MRLIPGPIISGCYEADAKTAGSVSLMLQAVAPILAFAPSHSELLLRGGTDASFAPPIDYMVQGFYPLGGGIVKVSTSPVQDSLTPISLLDPGSVKLLFGYTFVAGRVPVKVAHEMKDEASRCLRELFPSCPINIDSFRESDNRCQGNVATFMFVMQTSTDCLLAVSGISSPRGPHHRQLVSEACQSIYNYAKIGACCDDHMQDQLILPMSLAKGKSQIRIGPLTMHTKTCIYVAELMLGIKFEITELNDGCSIVSCNGIGYSRKVRKM
ncbi:unnamed protein product [Heterobilharzia americana]|nr:unnamed protein product [Heterobilharzia americana]